MRKVLLAVFFAACGLLLEVLGWVSSLAPWSGSDGVLGWYLLWHAAGSAFFSLAMLTFFPEEKIRPKKAMFLLVFAWCYALLAIGYITVLAAVLFMRYYKRDICSYEFKSVVLPSFDLHQRQPLGGFRQAGLEAYLGNSQVPVASRLGAMVALQNVSSKVSAPMLRKVLMDTEDDLRLLAYGMMDSREKKINKLIADELRNLDRCELEADRALASGLALNAMRRLSELYWELLYQDLVQGDVRVHALNSSLKYCRQVLEAEPVNAAVHLRVGRLCHELGDVEHAVMAYQRAIEHGLPIVRVLPYLAELEFERKNFSGACELMRELAGWRSHPRLQPVVDYWNR